MMSEEQDLTHRWVYPYYMGCMHSRFLRQNPQEKNMDVRLSLQQTLSSVNDGIIHELLTTHNWRHRLVGATFVGLQRRLPFVPLIGDLLYQSAAPYAGWGYCFALARCADNLSRVALICYLDRWLLRYNDDYDQKYALSTLLWIDVQQGRQEAQRYLASEGLWETYARHQHPIYQEQYTDLVARQRYLATIMTNCQRWFDVADEKAATIS